MLIKRNNRKLNPVKHGLISLAAAILLMFTSPIFSQDVHFSQIDNTQLMLNPANTGAFNGDQRASIHYKNQWSSVASPYKTYALNVDGSMLKAKLDGSFLGVGLVVYSDQAGDNRLGTTKADLSLAYHQKISDNSMITAGLVGGISQFSIDQSEMRWATQYDGIGHDPSLSSEENRDFNSFLKFDAGAGVLWSAHTADASLSSNDGMFITSGVSVYHVNRPQLSFSDLSEEKQFSRIVAHAKVSIGVKNTKLAIRPSFLYQRQGKQQETVMGSMIRYQLKEGSKYTGLVEEFAILIGAHYRVQDAIIASLMLERGHFALGISYDINVSTLRTASSTRGGTEISLKFTNPNPFGGKSGKVTNKSSRFL